MSPLRGDYHLENICRVKEVKYRVKQDIKIYDFSTLLLCCSISLDLLAHTCMMHWPHALGRKSLAICVQSGPLTANKRREQVFTMSSEISDPVTILVARLKSGRSNLPLV